MRAKALEHYSYDHPVSLRRHETSLTPLSYKLLGPDGPVFIDFYTAVAGKMEALAAKSPKRCSDILGMHTAAIEAAEARRQGQWLTEAALCGKWLSVRHHAVCAALKAGEPFAAIAKRSEELIDAKLRRVAPLVATLHTARLACVELEHAFESMGRDTDAAFGKLAACLGDATLTSFDFKGSGATEEVVTLVLRVRLSSDLLLSRRLSLTVPCSCARRWTACDAR